MRKWKDVVCPEEFVETVVDCTDVEWVEEEVHIGTCEMSEEGGCPFIEKNARSEDEEGNNVAPFSSDDVGRR